MGGAAYNVSLYAVSTGMCSQKVGEIDRIDSQFAAHVADFFAQLERFSAFEKWAEYQAADIGDGVRGQNRLPRVEGSQFAGVSAQRSTRDAQNVLYVFAADEPRAGQQSHP